jgi:hypothetical protein
VADGSVAGDADDTLNAFDAVAAALAGRPLEVVAGQPGPRGVAPGLSRGRSTAT